MCRGVESCTSLHPTLTTAPGMAMFWRWLRGQGGADDDAARRVVQRAAEAGVVTALVRLLEQGGSDEAKERAARAFSEKWYQTREAKPGFVEVRYTEVEPIAWRACSQSGQVVHVLAHGIHMLAMVSIACLACFRQPAIA